LKNRLKEIDDKKYSRHFSKVKMLKFELPSLPTQHQLLQQINQIEKENEELNREIEALEMKKKDVLERQLKG
jgi:restriction endonuclease S subunit